MINRRLALGVVYIIIGVLLSVLSFVSIVDEWWQSFGVAIFIVGIVDIIRYIKYRRNVEYKEKVDLSNSDERNRFLSMKAWSWAGYMFVIISGIGVIGFQIAGLRVWSIACSYCACLIMILYWICYMILKRKY
jgi:hypothetical protein